MTLRFHPDASSTVTSWGRRNSSTMVINVAAPLINEKSLSTQLPRTDISRLYARYVRTIESAPLVATRHRFLRVLVSVSGAPEGVWAAMFSRFLANSRMR